MHFRTCSVTCHQRLFKVFRKDKYLAAESVTLHEQNVELLCDSILFLQATWIFVFFYDHVIHELLLN